MFPNKSTVGPAVFDIVWKNQLFHDIFVESFRVSSSSKKEVGSWIVAGTNLPTKREGHGTSLSTEKCLSLDMLRIFYGGFRRPGTAPTHLPRYQSPVGKGRSNEKKGVPKRCEMKKCHAILQSCKFSWSTSSGSPSEVSRNARPKRSNIVRLCASEAPCDRPSVFNENAANELVISNSGHSAEMVARITSTQARIRSKCFGYAGWEGKALGLTASPWLVESSP